MKKIYLFLLFFLPVLHVSAQYRESLNILEKLIWDDKMLNIMVDTRIDFETDFLGDSLANAFFHGQTIKIWYAGEIVPGIRYRIRHRLNKPQTPLREGYSGAIDHAWISFDIGKRWTITAGKQSTQFGTFEYDYNGADVYLSSMCNGDLDLYRTGINAAYRFSNQTVNLQVVNANTPQFADEDHSSKALAAALMWEGDLFAEMLKTRWGYAIFQHNKSKFYNWVTLGTQLNIGKITAELDYFAGDRNMDYSSIVDLPDLGTRYVRDQSLAINLKYNFGKWKPSLKAIWDQRKDKDSDSNAYENSGVEALLEYYPFSGLIKDLRFHAAYYFKRTDFKGDFFGMDNEDNHTFLVGMRWLFKVK